MFNLSSLSERKLIFILCLVVFLVYFNSLFNGFVWDDFMQIINNDVVLNPKRIVELFKGGTFYSFGVLTSVYYKPLMSVSFMINYFLWGGEAFGFHLFQVVLHMTNVILVFLIFKNLFEKAVGNWAAFRLPKAEKKILPFLVALVWGIHPVNVESVAYIAGVQEVLYVFFSLFSLWLIMKGYSRAFLMAGILIFLAFLAKESALGGGLVILFYLFIFEREKVVKWLIFFILAMGLYFWLRLGVAKISIYNFLVGIPIMNASFKERLLTIPLEVFHYLRMIFWPQVLAVDQNFVVKRISFFEFLLPFGVDFLFFGGLLILGLRKRSKLYCFFWVWFLGSIGLILNIFPLDMTMSERWLYFPLIGFLGVLGLAALEVLEIKKSLKKYSSLIVFLILVGLSLRTVVRNFDWKNNLTLFTHDIKYSRNSSHLETLLGVELLCRGKFDEGKKHMQRAIELQPKYWTNYMNMGTLFLTEGNFEAAEINFQQAVENGLKYCKRDCPRVYEAVSGDLLSYGRYEKGWEFLEEGLLKYPDDDGLKKLKAQYQFDEETVDF